MMRTSREYDTRFPTRRRRKLTVGATALLFVVAAQAPASAATVYKEATLDPPSQCKGKDRINIQSIATGTVRHEFLLGPPHLGYKWQKRAAGSSRSSVSRISILRHKSVYDVRVSASTFKGQAPKINYAFYFCD